MERPKNPLRFVVVALTLVCLVLVAVLTAVVVVYVRQACTANDSIIDLSEPDRPGVFHELTQKELTAVKDYLYSLDRFTLLAPPDYRVNASHLFAVYLHLPAKQDVLKHLDEGGPQPTRKARVVLFRGDLSPPVVEEYIVGPLPNPTSCTLRISPSHTNPVDFDLRPFNLPEFISVFRVTLPTIDKKIGYILKESYDATFTECSSKCLTFFPSAVSSAIREERRKIWFRALRKIEQEYLHPLDFEFLVDTHSTDPNRFVIEKVMYSGHSYSSVDELARMYNESSIPKSKVPFPEKSDSLFSIANLRGNPVPDPPRAPPRMFEPDGRRFSIRQNQISYMQWEFDVSMHPFFGPRIYDIRFEKERVAYEISLQEIAVFYAGKSPSMRTANYLDSVSNIGSRSLNLVPGADCPETAVFMATYILSEVSDLPVRLDRSICVFEQNNGVPLRRHLAFDPSSNRYYAGMADSALVVRSVHSIGNYDYIIDFIFHQNGGLESRVMSTGYVTSTFNIAGEDLYGFQIHENIIGNIHQHLFHFKVDLDIAGTSNRYETLDIGAELVDNDFTTGDNKKDFGQIKYSRNMKMTELDAAFKFNFDSPKYHLIYNGHASRLGAHKAYRIHSTGLHKQVLPENVGNEQALSWARYQAAFTKFKDAEAESSSIFAMMDSLRPVVNFTKFLSDDEHIVDEDIVLWLPLGLYHIPHSEDLPVAATVGGHLGFFLLPYNYFEECPSMSSRDAIRYEQTSKDGEYRQYQNEADSICIQ